MDALFGAKVALCIFEGIVFRIDLLPSALHVTRRADDRSDPPEASHLASRAVGEMGGVVNAELLLAGAQVFHKRLSLHGRIGILIAPGTVHGIQILGADGSFRIADNVLMILELLGIRSFNQLTEVVFLYCQVFVYVSVVMVFLHASGLL